MGADRPPRIVVYTPGLEFDSVIEGTLRGKRIGSGCSLGCGGLPRDIEFEYESVEARDADLERGQKLLPRMKWTAR